MSDSFLLRHAHGSTEACRDGIGTSLWEILDAFLQSRLFVNSAQIWLEPMQNRCRIWTNQRLWMVKPCFNECKASLRDNPGLLISWAAPKFQSLITFGRSDTWRIKNDSAHAVGKKQHTAISWQRLGWELQSQIKISTRKTLGVLRCSSAKRNFDLVTVARRVLVKFWRKHTIKLSSSKNCRISRNRRIGTSLF